MYVSTGERVQCECSVHHCASPFLQEKQIWNVFSPPVLNICFTKNLEYISYGRGHVNSKNRTAKGVCILRQSSKRVVQPQTADTSLIEPTLCLELTKYYMHQSLQDCWRRHHSEHSDSSHQNYRPESKLRCLTSSSDFSSNVQGTGPSVIFVTHQVYLRAEFYRCAQNGELLTIQK